MMDSRQEERTERLAPEIESALLGLRPTVPVGFARRAAMRFEAALARRRFRRWLMGTVSMATAASVLVWFTLFNVGQVRDAVWHGLVAAVTLVKSLFTLWSHIPGFGIFFGVFGMLMTLLLAGVVSKLDNRVLAK